MPEKKITESNRDIRMLDAPGGEDSDGVRCPPYRAILLLTELIDKGWCVKENAKNIREIVDALKNAKDEGIMYGVFVPLGEYDYYNKKYGFSMIISQNAQR